MEFPRIASQDPNSDRSPLYDVRNPARASRWGRDVRSDVSRTMFWRPVSPSSLFRATPGTLRSPCPAVPRIAEGEAWWSQTGSNRRPHACKARALPAELWPRTRRRMLRRASRALAFACATAQQPSFKRASRAEAAEQRRLVGLGRLELPTSRLSSARSNQLSYKPLTTRDQLARHRPTGRMHRTSAKPLARVRPRRKRNEDGEIPPMELNNPETVGP